MSSRNNLRILVTGSRNWADTQTIQRVMASIESANPDRKFTLIEGGCPTGADAMAVREATRLGWAIETHNADWEHHGRIAGPMRNRKMVNSGVFVCIAFIKNSSRGATHLCELCQESGY